MIVRRYIRLYILLYGVKCEKILEVINTERLLDDPRNSLWSRDKYQDRCFRPVVVSLTTLFLVR